MTEHELKAFAQRIRRHVVDMTHRAKSSHVGSCLSAAEILAVLYGEILRVTPQTHDDPDRDRFILSKGHACAALYAALAGRGFFPEERLEGFYQNGGRLAGHATHKDVPGVEVSTGSLGHGLGIAAGMALAGKIDERPYRVMCLLSDGECDEGSIWEAALFAPHHRLDNLTVIVDYNKIQSLGHVRDVLDLEPFARKWESFGWTACEVDGHCIASLSGRLKSLPFTARKPSCIIAHTIKGKGVSFMENHLLWHYRTPQGDEYAAALGELEAAT
ncbi:MAG: transketolase [Planctomycetaceae bacterium]